MTYYIHTRSLEPGMGYCDTGIEHRLLTDDFGHPYVTFSDRERAQEMCNDLNEQHPTADLIVILHDEQPTTTKHTETEFVTNRQWDGLASRIERSNLKKTGKSLSRTGIARRAQSFIVDIQPDKNGMIVRRGWRDAMRNPF